MQPKHSEPNSWQPGCVSFHSCRWQLVGEPHCHLPANITAMSSCILCSSSQQREAFSFALRGSVCCYIASPRLSSMAKVLVFSGPREKTLVNAMGSIYTPHHFWSTHLCPSHHPPPHHHPPLTPQAGRSVGNFLIRDPLWELPSAASAKVTAFPGGFPHPTPAQLRGVREVGRGRSTTPWSSL